MFNDFNWSQYFTYIIRWAVLAVPGAVFLVWVRRYISGWLASMIVSQTILGAVVYFIDRIIFNL